MIYNSAITECTGWFEQYTHNFMTEGVTLAILSFCGPEHGIETVARNLENTHSLDYLAQRKKQCFKVVDMKQQIYIYFLSLPPVIYIQ